MKQVKNVCKSVAYSALDVLTGGRGIARTIGGEMIRFPPHFSRYYESDYEPATFDFLRQNLSKGDVYLDCGGHIGLFAVVGARIVGDTGRVYSFEPTPFSRSVLETASNRVAAFCPSRSGFIPISLKLFCKTGNRR